MASMDEQILRTSKEIIVKFIETGRISPTTFHESFKQIYTTIQETVNKDQTDSKHEVIPQDHDKKQ